MAVLDDNGKLIAELHPAVYFDSSVLIEYWRAEGGGDPDEDELLIPPDPFDELVRGLVVKSEERFEQMVEMRKKIESGESKLTAIASPAGLFELLKWYAQTGFRSAASQVIEPRVSRSWDGKQVGSYLKRAFDQWHAERQAVEDGALQSVTNELKNFMACTVPGSGYAEAYGLAGIVYAEVKDFNLVFGEVYNSWSLPYLQLDAADFMHVLFAKRLGCEYLASFDQDFQRTAESIERLYKIRVLTDHAQLFAAL